ncbi:hypothetical protein BD770DRAFT_443807 [Pilaira anomala]|nr:hypothetical protein BD770DRAFT_443807 [Pilaira anomala]
MSKLTFFVTQFPIETKVEIFPAHFSYDDEKFVDHDLNIGWAMSVDNSYHVNAKKTNLKEGEHRKDYRVVKTCQGALQCMNSFCTLYKVDTRPPTKEELTKTRKCLICQELVAWTKCKVKAVFYFSFKRMDCTMTHIINKSKGIFHDHGSYSQKHLTQDQLEKVDELVKSHHAITANSGLTCIAEGKNVTPDEDIDVLINMDRVKHELRASRIRNGLNIRTNDLFEEFTKIEDEFPNFFNSAELVSSKFCLTFSAPMMTMSKLPFETHPMITDVAYKAVRDGYYLCSTVMQRHVVIFQAVIKSLTTERFTQYFEALFAKFSIKPESFLVMIMDFSMAQHEGFLISFGFSKAQAMSFLIGCYMHWKQSVQRIVSNHAVVSPEKAQRFLNLTYNMQRTTVDVIFDDTVQNILREFPNSRRWVQWWIQLSIAPCYGNKKRKSRKDDDNDGRAPDTTKTLVTKAKKNESDSQSDNENTTVEIVDERLDLFKSHNSVVLEVLGGMSIKLTCFVVDDPVEILGNGTCDYVTAFQNKKQGSDERKMIEDKTDVDHEDNDDYLAIQRSLEINLDNKDDKDDRKK